MTNQAIYLIVGLFAVIFILSRIKATKTKGGKYIIDENISTVPGFSRVEPDLRTEEERLLETELGGQVISRGMLDSFPANILYYYDSGRRRNGRSGMSSSRMTLALRLPRPAPFTFTVEPKLPLLLRGAPPKEPEVLTGDPEFDERFRVYSNEGQFVQEYLNPKLRNMLVSLRRQISPDLPDDGGGWKAAASGVMMGKLRIKGGTLSFSINQSLSEETVSKLHTALPVITQFAAEAMKS